MIRSEQAAEASNMVPGPDDERLNEARPFKMLTPGTMISHYEILGKVGEGGMGVVYKATDAKLDRTVALKFLPPHLLCDSEARERFEHEAKAASALNHPNIATIHEIDEKEGRCFIAMEYLEGGSLKNLAETKDLAPSEILDLAIQIGEGLDAAHTGGVVHRDIKPDNIMLTKTGLPKIMDFGLAKLKGAARVTKTRTTLGTLQYMSPEQVSGQDVDHRSDIFSFGVILYELITGQLPFRGEYEAAVIYSILNETPEPVARYKTGVAEGLGRIVDRMLSKDRNTRYQSAADVVAELRGLKEGTRVSIKGTGIKRAIGARPIVLVAVASVVVVAGYIGLSRLLAPSGPEGTTTREKSIVVLPFEDISPGKDNEYFSDGLTEEIITDLSKIQALRVISRSSAMVLKGTRKDMRTIARDLNIQYVLEGSVRKAGDDLRITAQLIDAANDEHLWAEKYTCTLDDIFDVQEQVSRSIASAIKIELSPEEDRRIAERAIADVRAYEAYLMARHDILSYTEDGLNRALRNLQNALSITGPNVLVYSALGYVYYQFWNVGVELDEAYLSQAQEYADKIFELEPDSPHGHLLLGLLEVSGGSVGGAARHFEKTLARDPNNSEALAWLSALYAFLGQKPAAEALAGRVSEIDPFHPFAYLIPALIDIYTGQFDSARERLEDQYRIKGDEMLMQVWYVWGHAYAGRDDEAISMIDHMAVDSADNLVIRLCVSLKYALQGRKAEMLASIGPEMRTWAEKDFNYSQWLAECYAVAGESQEALSWLENAVNHGLVNYPFLNEYDPLLENIRGEERFQQLMARVKHEWEHPEVSL
jgi:serine/threonine protein kinase/tetratricopeptide (TPR) repeat protein